MILFINIVSNYPLKVDLKFTKRMSRNTIFVKKIKIICILYSCLKSDSMFDFKRLFDSFSKLSSTKFYKDTFDH